MTTAKNRVMQNNIDLSFKRIAELRTELDYLHTRVNRMDHKLNDIEQASEQIGDVVALKTTDKIIKSKSLQDLEFYENPLVAGLICPVCDKPKDKHNNRTWMKHYFEIMDRPFKDTLEQTEEIVKEMKENAVQVWSRFDG